MNAAIIGLGKMGAALELALIARGHAVCARVGAGETLAVNDAQIAFEFTTPDAAAANVTRLLQLGIPTICGTTGWDSDGANELAGQRGVPLLIAPNFSIGAFVMRELAQAMALRLRGFPEFQPGIVERHHREKKDIPSGTARALAQLVDGARPQQPATAIVSLRQGEQPGEHQLIFDGPDESLELVHRVRSRGVFAAGAVRAGEWLLQTKPRGAVSFEQFIAGSLS